MNHVSFLMHIRVKAPGRNPDRASADAHVEHGQTARGQTSKHIQSVTAQASRIKTTHWQHAPEYLRRLEEPTREGSLADLLRKLHYNSHNPTNNSKGRYKFDQEEAQPSLTKQIFWYRISGPPLPSSIGLVHRR
jgi:hypothetical protein